MAIEIFPLPVTTAGTSGSPGVVYVLRGFQCILYSITMGETLK